MLYNNRMYVLRCDEKTCFVRSVGRDSRYGQTQVGPKRRNYTAVHYVLAGSGWFDNIKIRAGQGFLFPAGETHSFRADPEDPWYFVFLELGQGFAEQIARPILNVDAHGIFSYSFDDWLWKWADKTFRNEPVALVSEAEALYHVSTVFHKHAAALTCPADNQNLHVQRAKLYIERNLSRQLTVSKVAKFVNLNERYLCSLFARYENVSTKDYITSKKLQTACELLQSTQLPVKEVALSVGFMDANCFSRFFKKEMKCSPSQYREQDR